MADLLGVDAHEVALVPNTSFGVNLAAALVASGPPGRIVVSAGEFPANVLPWKALASRGFGVEIVPADEHGSPDEEALLAALDGPDVRALAISAVQFVTGYRADLEALGAACRDRGLLYCIDAIQAVGAVPFHPKALHADIVACGGQKWLCAPWGSGFAWIAERHHERFEPPMVSWLGMQGGADFSNMLHYRMEWRTDARKFELATNGIQDYLGLARSAEIFNEIGAAAVEVHLQGVLAPLWEWIESRPDARACTPSAAHRRAGIVSFRSPAAQRYAEVLRAHRVVASLREGALRFAPHFYNTRGEMERVVELLDGVGPG